VTLGGVLFVTGIGDVPMVRLAFYQDRFALGTTAAILADLIALSAFFFRRISSPTFCNGKWETENARHRCQYQSLPSFEHLEASPFFSCLCSYSLGAVGMELTRDSTTGQRSTIFHRAGR